MITYEDIGGVGILRYNTASLTSANAATTYTLMDVFPNKKINRIEIYPSSSTQTIAYLTAVIYADDN